MTKVRLNQEDLQAMIFTINTLRMKEFYVGFNSRTYAALKQLTLESADVATKMNDGEF